MKYVRILLPPSIALVFALSQYVYAATQYTNPANQVDINAAFLTFATLWPTCAKLLAMQLPAEDGDGDEQGDDGSDTGGLGPSEFVAKERN